MNVEETAQIISMDLGTIILIIGSVCAGTFALAGVFISVYVSARVKIARLEVNVDILKKNCNDLGAKVRNFLQGER